MAKSLDSRQRRAVLIAAILASSMAFIDSTALNVALPALQRSLELSGLQMLWVVNAYTLFLAALMLVGGSLGDYYGKKRIFGLGIFTFTFFSIVCGLSPSGDFLIVSRAFQGLGGALMVPGSLSLITASFPQKSRGKAIGIWSMFSAFTTILGPLIGGYLAQIGLWRGIFFINLPLGLVCGWLLWKQVPEPSLTKSIKLDWKGGVLASLGVFSLTFGFLEAGELGFQNFYIAMAILAGSLLLAAFLWHENKTQYPMLPLKLFQSKTFSAANGITMFTYGAMSTVLFFVPLNLIQIQGYTETQAGLAILPFGGVIALFSSISGKLTDNMGAKIPLIIGQTVTGLGILWLGTIGMTAGFEDFWSTYFPALATAGAGMGFTVVPLTTSVMNCVTERESGIASGVNNTIARLANVLFLALIGALALIYFRESLLDASAEKLPPQQQEYLAQAAQDLAETQPDPKWSTSTRNTVYQLVDLSFLRTFRWVSICASILCWLSVLISAFFVAGKPKKIKLE